MANNEKIEIIVVTPHVAKHLTLLGVDKKHFFITNAPDDCAINLTKEELLKDVSIEIVRHAPELPGVTHAEINRRTSVACEQMRLFKTMTLMCGAGGMDIGLAQSNGKGYFRTCWAVEWSKTSMATFKLHHPFTTTFEMDIGKVLHERESLQGMPKRGEVDVIVSGPPCQPFSSLNRTKARTSKHDPRSLLVATTLSFIDVYRPTYGCIENVVGILGRGDLGTVPRVGVITFIRNCLETLGYNARFCKVQCGEFGIPQRRARVKILFARKDVRLPLAPTPTTQLVGCSVKGGGPLPGITIEDATSDLPRWEFKNPHIAYGKGTLKDTRSVRERPMEYEREQGRGTIGPMRCKYTSEPLNDFQRLVRPGHFAKADTPISHHQTLALDALTVERICNIPFDAGANHLDLLKKRSRLALEQSIELDDPNAFKQAFRRLDLKEPFQIVTTTLYVGGKLGRLLMPDQNRIPTLRELARAQGWPDSIDFKGSPAEVLKQIGNAVPIPVATAIGLSIREAAMLDYLDGDRRFARRS